MLQELALESTALTQLPYAVLQEAYDVASEHGLSSIQRLLFADPVRPADDIDEAFTSNEHYELPLGNRRQAARGRDRNVIDRLLHDRNWRVIELLLNNPLLTERDVIALLRDVLRDQRFLLLLQATQNGRRGIVFARRWSATPIHRMHWANN